MQRNEAGVIEVGTRSARVPPLLGIPPMTREQTRDQKPNEAAPVQDTSDVDPHDETAVFKAPRGPSEPRPPWSGIRRFSELSAQEIYTRLAELRAHGVARDAETGALIGPIQLTEDGQVLLPFGARAVALDVSIQSYLAAYRFTLKPGEGAPQTVERIALRHHARVGMASRVRVRAVLSGRDVEGAVLEVSATGLSFAPAANSTGLQPGTRLNEFYVTWKGGKRLRFEADVVHHDPSDSTTPARVGVRLAGSLRALQEWTALVEELLHPAASTTRVEARALWRLYARAGYFNLSGQGIEAFSGVLPSFLAAQSLLGDAPEIGACFTAGTGAEPDACMHQVQLWPGSWMAFNLCRDARGRSLRTSDDSVLLDLYGRSYGFVAQQAEARWLISYTQAEAGFSRYVNHRHASSLGDPSRACVLPFEAVEIKVSRDTRSPSNIRVAGQSDTECLRQAVAVRWPLAYVEASGLAEPGLSNESVERLWAGAGLERRREVLVAVEDGQVIAGAILEFVAEGVHVYSLFDQCRLVAVTPEGQRAFDALLCAASERYAKAGRSKFVYFKDPDDPAVGEELESLSLGVADINVFHRDYLGDFLEHVYLCLAPNLHSGGSRGVATRGSGAFRAALQSEAPKSSRSGVKREQA
jgi:hypothetical protein